MKRVVSVARDFTPFPSGRYKKNGPTSGEEFRDRFLLTAIRDRSQLVVQLDGTIGYGSSFLEEAFGGMVRALGAESKLLSDLLTLETGNDVLRQEIHSYIDAELGKLKATGIA